MQVFDLTRCHDGRPHAFRRELIYGCCPRHGVEVLTCTRADCGNTIVRGGLADRFARAVGAEEPLYRGAWNPPARWTPDQLTDVVREMSRIFVPANDTQENLN